MPDKTNGTNRTSVRDLLSVRPRRGQVDLAAIHPSETHGLKGQKADKRYELINRFEADAVKHGTVPLKLFLLITPDEQRDGLLARLGEPEKQRIANASCLRHISNPAMELRK